MPTIVGDADHVGDVRFGVDHYIAGPGIEALPACIGPTNVGLAPVLKRSGHGAQLAVEPGIRLHACHLDVGGTAVGRTAVACAVADGHTRAGAPPVGVAYRSADGDVGEVRRMVQVVGDLEDVPAGPIGLGKSTAVPVEHAATTLIGGVAVVLIHCTHPEGYSDPDRIRAARLQPAHGERVVGLAAAEGGDGRLLWCVGGRDRRRGDSIVVPAGNAVHHN